MRLVSVIFIAFTILESQALAEIPDRWLERARGFEQGVELQGRHRADMILLIASRSPRGPASRSRQVENELFRQSEMQEFLQGYVRVMLVIPGDTETTELANDRFRVQHGPRLFVIRPGGWTTPIGLFDREQDRRILRSAEDIKERIRAASSPNRPGANVPRR